MFDIFKKRKWELEILPILEGSFKEINISISNFSCHKDQSTGKRKYLYSNFGNEFINEIHEQLGKFEKLQQELENHGFKTIIVNMPDVPPISIELKSKKPKGKRKFYSDIADAIINAFDSHKIKP